MKAFGFWFPSRHIT